jgi:hypothetical protein
VSLANVWVQARDGSLVRGDRVGEITLHQTPEIVGKPSRWLLDVAVAVPVGSGGPDGWRTGPLHRTLAQTDRAPREAPAALARLLAQLDAVDAAGIVRADTAHVRAAPHPERTVASGEIHFGFTAFSGAAGPSSINAAAPPRLNGSQSGEPRELVSGEPTSGGTRRG